MMLDSTVLEAVRTIVACRSAHREWQATLAQAEMMPTVQNKTREHIAHSVWRQAVKERDSAVALASK